MTREPEEPFLFDLPLSGPPPALADAHRGESPARRGSRRSARPESLPLFDDDELPPSGSEPVASEPSHGARPPAAPRGPVPVPRPAAREAARHSGAGGSATSAMPAAAAATAAFAGSAADGSKALASPAPIAPRLRAACGDVAILLGVGAVAAVGATLLGAELSLASLPALVVFLLSFSFLYCVVSLAFWGQTPGMAWSGLIARSEETEPLSFGQTALRWLGHWLTWMLLGLPGLLALSGRSLADRLSGSGTYETPFSGSTAA